MAAPRAIIDADTLYRRHPRNLLVWHAIEGLFELYWSARILDEARDNLAAKVTMVEQDASEKADRRLSRATDAVYASGAGGEVHEDHINVIEPRMTNSPKDRHVLAAAVACAASTVVTTNKSDFPRASTQPLGIVAQSPDEFLTSMLSPETVDAARLALRRQADFHRWPLSRLLTLLATPGQHGPAIAPTYVSRIVDFGAS